jgi:aminopeptidase N
LFKDSVKVGKNKVEVFFINKYRFTGTGLHKFEDPADKEEYLYTQFEPFHAHRVIPCFDQPDIKGTMTLSTVVPKDYVSLSNSHEEEEYTNEENPDQCRVFFEENDFLVVIDDLGSHRVTKFSKTPKISSYLFAIIAGPYDVVEKEAEIPGKDAPIRMRFMCRKSIKDSISRAYGDMYEGVVTGIKWYTEFFGTPFPWTKYDQIFCPEFKYGAMENVGAVTFSENYIPTGNFGVTHLTRLLNTTLHELCHQWFGNLVTMEWWNDLWLNEAFATYMAYLCTAENDNLFRKTPGTWITMNTRKFFANNYDTLSTTHPIKKDAATTDSADDMVNAITYGKGSAFIKQLIHMIGKAAMSKGCSIYFSKHAWGNTTLDDFLDALIEGCNEVGKELEVDLREFCINFLTTKGVNILMPKVEEHKGGIKLTITQTKGRYSDGFLNQKIDYRLYDKDMNCEEHSLILNKDGTPSIRYFENRTETDTFVFLNANDHAYAQVRFRDGFVQKFIEGDLIKIDDSLNRIIVWRSLIAMVRNVQIKSTEFFSIVLNNIFEENDIILLDTVLNTVKGFIVSYIPEDKFVSLCKQMFDKLYKRYLEIPDSEIELKNCLKSSLCAYLADEEHIKLAAQWLDDESMSLDDENKELILLTIYKTPYFTKEDKNDMLTKYAGDRESDKLKRLKFSCSTALPDKDNKARAWEIITHPKERELSSYDYRAYLHGFHSRHQKDITEEYVQKYLEELPNFARCGEKDYMTIFVTGAFPASYFVTREFLAEVKKVTDEFEQEDRVKYDSFLRVVNSIYESESGKLKIKEEAMKK